MKAPTDRQIETWMRQYVEASSAMVRPNRPPEKITIDDEVEGAYPTWRGLQARLATLRTEIEAAFSDVAAGFAKAPDFARMRRGSEVLGEYMLHQSHDGTLASLDAYVTGLEHHGKVPPKEAEQTRRELAILRGEVRE